MSAAIVLFNRDLRVHDHPALAEAHRRADEVVPLFVVDEAIARRRFASPNRARFLVEALDDLRQALRQRGADLVVRRGDPAAEVVSLAAQVQADTIFTSGDVTAYARSRQRRVEDAAKQHRIQFAAMPGVTVVEPGALVPAAGDHYRVFTPYWHVWQRAPWRPVAATPGSMHLPPGVDPGDLPESSELAEGGVSPELPRGGEEVARQLVGAWVRAGLEGYGDHADDLAGDATSRLSPYLHFGCVSPLEVASWVRERAGAEPFLRQLCWRDFHHQVVAAFPAIATKDYRPRGDRWHDDPEAAAAWREAQTGYPIVDAGMRQLQREGWMHNRSRLIVASFLTKSLYIDWRTGAAHFLDWLVDGDIVNNSANWQWVAGTGNDTRPNRRLNPLRQAARFDPTGEYVRRYVPELAAIEGAAVHEPWKLPAGQRRGLDYPPPIVDPIGTSTASSRRPG